MDFVSPGRVPPGVKAQLRDQPRRWLHRQNSATSGAEFEGVSLPRAQVPAVNKIHGLRPYNHKIYSALRKNKVPNPVLLMHIWHHRRYRTIATTAAPRVGAAVVHTL